MSLLDSNIIIHSAQAKHQALRRFIEARSPVVSAISYVEVLGFHRLEAENKATLQAFFDATTILPLTSAVLNQAVLLRQRRKLSLGDALVAATCLVHDLRLITRNTKDFTGIVNLGLLNPFELPEVLAEERG